MQIVYTRPTLLSLRHFLDHPAIKRAVTRRLHFTCEQAADRGLQPLVWNTHLRALCILDIAHEQRVRLLDLWLFFLARPVDVLDDAAAALRRLLLEEAVDRIQLYSIVRSYMMRMQV